MGFMCECFWLKYILVTPPTLYLLEQQSSIESEYITFHFGVHWVSAQILILLTGYEWMNSEYYQNTQAHLPSEIYPSGINFTQMSCIHALKNIPVFSTSVVKYSSIKVFHYYNYSSITWMMCTEYDWVSGISHWVFHPSLLSSLAEGQ